MTIAFTYKTNWSSTPRTLHLRSDCTVGQLATLIGFRPDGLRLDGTLVSSSQTFLTNDEKQGVQQTHFVFGMPFMSVHSQCCHPVFYVQKLDD